MQALTTDISVALRPLEVVKRLFPSAIVAGGFLRDLHFGRTPKDVDIFIAYEDYDANFINSIDKLSMTMVPGSPSLAPHELYCSFNLSGFDVPVQVMVLVPGLSPAERVEMFDFDFCQLYHDGWVIRTSPAFDEMTAGVVRIVYCENESEFARSMSRWKRLSQKYPDFRLEVPTKYLPLRALLEQEQA